MSAAPETVLKKQDRKKLSAEEKVKLVAQLRKKKMMKRRVLYKRAEKYAQEYLSAERALIKQRRKARAEGLLFREPEAKLALVVRIKGINQVDPRSRKILQLLRLRQINNAVFVRLSKATIEMLRAVEPYIAYGYPNLKTVRELIYKRGFARVHGQRVPITSNKVIEQALGQHGVICIEDVIHEIFTVGKNFKNVNRFLWPFKLNNPTGGWAKKTVHYIERGDAGNRDTKINSLAQKMI